MSGMTREEAIRLLGVIDTICTMQMGDYGEREHKAMLMAIADMEKQIPKKPILEERCRPFACDNWKCPNCETEFPWEIEAELKVKEYHNCPYCGQAIVGGDWGEEND